MLLAPGAKGIIRTAPTRNKRTGRTTAAQSVPQLTRPIALVEERKVIAPGHSQWSPAGAPAHLVHQTDAEANQVGLGMRIDDDMGSTEPGLAAAAIRFELHAGRVEVGER